MYFFDVIPLVEKSTLLLLPFFIVNLWVEKYTLLTRTFLYEILMTKISMSFLIKLQAIENIREGFPLLVTLNS